LGGRSSVPSPAAGRPVPRRLQPHEPAGTPQATQSATGAAPVTRTPSQPPLVVGAQEPATCWLEARRGLREARARCRRVAREPAAQPRLGLWLANGLRL